MCLLTNLKFRVIKGAYTRSTETTSMHFKMVLNVVLKLIKEYIKASNTTLEAEDDN